MSEHPPSSTTAESPRRRVQMGPTPYPELKMPLNYEDICRILPHRYPFLLVDRITELEPGVRCVGLKNLTATEEYFQGHFPGHPIMPGVLILEAMAQVAGVLTLVSRNTPGELWYFAKIEEAKFKQPVRPGDQLRMEIMMEVLRSGVCKVSAQGWVDGNVVVEAEMTFVKNTDPQTIGNITSHAGYNGAVPESNGNLSKHQSAASVTSSSPIVAPVATVPAVPLSNGAGYGSPLTSSNGNANNGSLNGSATREGVQIHPTAVVDPDAVLEEGVVIGPHCVVEGGVHIGAETQLDAQVVIKRFTTIGKRCRVWPGTVLGGEPQDMKFKGEESYLRIGDDNQLREMITIHRATGEGAATTVGDSNLLMGYVHIGHNCKIGNHNMISSLTGLSGHVTVEDKCVIGGFVGVHQFVHIGKMAMVGGLSKVVQDVPPFCMADGRPSKTHGLNIRGLRRNGVPAETRTEVTQAVKLLYRSGLNTSEALARIKAEIPRSETLDYLVSYIERMGEGRLNRQDEGSHL